MRLSRSKISCIYAQHNAGQENDGTWRINARLPAESGSLVVKAIVAVARPLQLEKQAEIIEGYKQQA